MKTDPMVQWLRLPTANPEVLGLESRVRYGFLWLLVFFAVLGKVLTNFDDFGLESY
jgi:hypothetical protein